MKNEVILNGVDEASPDAEMPEGWAAATLEDIGDLYCGQSPATRFVNTTHVGTPYMTGPGQWDGNELHVDKWTTDPRRTVPEGCIFVTVKGAGVGTIFPGVRGAIGRDIYAFKPAVEVHDSFVRRALEFTVSEIKRNAAGDIPGLSKDHLLKHCVNVPPCDEQKRIISAIDNLFVLSKSARDHLSRVPAILKRFRQAVLAAACSGRLTEDWREKQRPTEDAHVLLSRILATREAQWQSAQITKASRRGKKLSSNKWKLKYEHPSAPETSELDEIPPYWAWATVGRLYEVKYGLSEPLRKTVPEMPDDLPIISMANITDGGTLVLDGLRYFPIAENKRPGLLLRRGDLLFNWRNAPKWIGKTAIFDLDGDYVNASFLLRLRPPLPEDDGRFVWLYLNHLRFQGFFNFASRAAVNQSNFNATETSKILVPLPPLSEQQEILRCVRDLFTLSEQIEQRLNAATCRADALTQSILAKAFRGELFPTEAELARRQGREYEPASVLLERIKREREARNVAKNPRKRPPKQIASAAARA